MPAPRAPPEHGPVIALAGADEDSSASERPSEHAAASSAPTAAPAVPVAVPDPPAAIEANAGQWLIMVTIFLVVLATGWAMYPYGTYVAILAASVLLAAALYAINALLANRQQEATINASVRHGATPA